MSDTPWWYLSYAGDEGFRGGCIIQAPNFLEACFTARVLKISPGGEVAGDEIPKEQLPAERYRHRLLTRSEIEQFWSVASIKEVEDLAKNDPEGLQCWLNADDRGGPRNA